MGSMVTRRIAVAGLFGACWFVTEAARAEVAPEVLHVLKRFHIVYGDGEAEPARTAALGILKRLEDAGAGDRVTREATEYYVACCAFRVGSRKKAHAIAAEIIKEPTNVNGPEAELLLYWLECTAPRNDHAQPPLAPGEFLKAYRADLAKIARWYPAGHAAQSVLFWTPRKQAPKRKGEVRFWIWEDPYPAKFHYWPMFKAGRMYYDMGMFRESIKAYKRSAGFYEDDDWISERTVGLWQGMGDAYRALGEWKQALACYYKAVACGGRLRGLLPPLREADRGVRQKTPVKPGKAKPDAATLEKIAKICMRTELYDDALEAADAASEVRKKPNVKLRDEIYLAKARTLECVMASKQEGVTFRGWKVTKETIAEAYRAGHATPPTKP